MKRAGLGARLGLVAATVVAFLPAVTGSTRLSAAPTLPAGFRDEPVAALPLPTATAFTPDGRMLVTSQPGQLHVLSPAGDVAASPALDLAGKICTDGERGLVGLAVDPDFAANGWIYLYYTFSKGTDCPRRADPHPVNRVARFTLPSTNIIDPASEVVIVDHIPSRGGDHNGGDLHFGADGLLYISVGDNLCRLPAADGSRCHADNNTARSLSHLLGKILRIHPDGTIPADNPFAAAPGARRCGDPAGLPAGSGPCQETYAFGLRNPFRFAFRPGTTEFYINDVGQYRWEEINVGQAGADYGWNIREGLCANGSTTDCGPAPAGLVNPIFQYPHASGCSAITGGAFVPPGAWPAEYDGAYLFGDYTCGKIFRLVPEPGGGFRADEFATGLGVTSAINLMFGPHGVGEALYYTSYELGGQLRRIVYSPIAAP